MARTGSLNPDTGAFPLGHPALGEALLTYIGNKRKLIPFIADGIDRIEERLGPISTMADPFAGSGVVSRLGRLRGYTVTAGDIEEYTRPFGRAFLEVKPQDVDRVFESTGGYRCTLETLNALVTPRDEDRLFSKHYAPQDTDRADPDGERLFYTQENAAKIDAILAAIHRDLPLSDLGRDILLAGVLTEMSIHINTSGVMKGFHRGWGGRGGDALSRILAPVELEPLPFIDGPPGRTYVGAAETVMRSARDELRAGAGTDGIGGPPPRTFDLVYADPPYTIHQYGANYHLLTTATRWDFYDPGPVSPGRRAGIRRDHIRSDFCSRDGDRAKRAFERFLDAVDTRALLISYNNDGILSAEEILDLLSEDGINTVEVFQREYHKFRGGKATQATTKTSEYLFSVLRGVRQSRHSRDDVRGAVEEMVLMRRTADRFIVPSRWERAGGAVAAHGALVLTTPAGSRVAVSPELRVESIDIAGGSPEEIAFLERLAGESTTDIVGAIEELVRCGSYRPAIRLLQRLKIKKYRADFDRIAAVITSAPLSDAERTQLQRVIRRVRGENAPADQPPSHR